MTGYDTHFSLITPVVKSVNALFPERISADAGAHISTIIMGMVVFVTTFAPFLVNRFGCRMILTIGACMISLYLSSYFYVHIYTMFPLLVFAGTGYTFFHLSYGQYLTEVSTPASIQRNSAISWALGATSMILGGVIMMATKAMTMEIDGTDDSVNATLYNATDSASGSGDLQRTHNYSMHEIYAIFGSFVAFSLLSALIFALIPKRKDDDAAKPIKRTFLQEFGNLACTVIDPRMIGIAPLSLLIGVAQGLFNTVYPNALHHTAMHKSDDIAWMLPFLPGAYMVALGIGEVLAGIMVTQLAKKFKKYGRVAVILVGCAVEIIGIVVVVLSTPLDANMGYPKDERTVISPSIEMALFVGLLFGFADSCFNTTRTFMIALALKERSSYAFGLSRAYQCLVRAMVSLTSLRLPITAYFVAVCVTVVLALIPFFWTMRRQTAKVQDDNISIADVAYQELE